MRELGGVPTLRDVPEPQLQGTTLGHGGLHIPHEVHGVLGVTRFSAACVFEDKQTERKCSMNSCNALLSTSIAQACCLIALSAAPCQPVRCANRQTSTRCIDLQPVKDQNGRNSQHACNYFQLFVLRPTSPAAVGRCSTVCLSAP